MGTVTLVLSALLSVLSMNLTYVVLGVVVFAGGIYGGIKSPNFKKGYKASENWVFKIKTIENLLEKRVLSDTSSRF
ncbi:hypothetical protein N9Y48_04200 [Zobellia sp.]|nr:hypothetical protein [Zobellia sp.]